MTVTAVGILLSADGLASRRLGDDWRTRTVAWANPACELRRYHDLPLPVSLEEHYSDTPIGEIVGVHHAEGRRHRRLAIAELTADAPEGLLRAKGLEPSTYGLGSRRSTN